MDSFSDSLSYRYNKKLFFVLAVLLLSIFAITFTWQQDTNLKNILILCFATSSLIISFTLFRSAKKFVNKHQKFLDILRVSPNPLYIKDQDGKIKYLNDAMASLYGLSIDESLGKTEQQLITEQNLSIIKKGNHQEILKNNQHYLFTNFPFKMVNGYKYTFVSAKNVTELTNTKNESEKNNNKLQCVLDASQEGLWEWNLVTDKWTCDQQCKKITGWNTHLSSFAEYEQCILEEDKPNVLKCFTQFLEEDQPFDIQYRIKKQNGEIIWIWDRCMVAERDQQNQPVNIIGIIQDVTQDKLNQDKVHRLAYYDPLTTLPNRTLLNQHLEEALKSSIEHNTFTAVFILNIDRFKVLNESYGHIIGDQLLVEVAKTIKSSLQPEDIIGRFSGDEFIVIIKNLGSNITRASKQAKKAAKKIKDILTLPIELKIKNSITTPLNYHTTVSIGGVISKTDSYDKDTLLKLSDVALHKVKKRGGNDYMIVDPDLQIELNQTAGLYKSLSYALEENELSLHYQPQYNINQKMIGAEALLRWNSDKFGMVPPSTFIPIAEDSNLIIEMGYWVITQACQQLELWKKDPRLSQLQLSINLSAKQIWQEDFVFLAKNIIHHYDIDPAKITFEITESILIRDVPDTVRKLNALKEMGSRISLDDFGTGYSSLSYLKNFPIDEIKIDRSFIQYLNTNHSDLIMVKSIIELGKNFNLNVVSEGVEDQEQLDKLITLGAKVFQGFLLSRPLPIDEFLKAAHKKTHDEKSKETMNSIAFI